MTDEAHEVDREAELRLALRLLEQGEHAHAVQHLSGAVSERPHDPRVDEALEQLCRAVDDPLALVPLDEAPFVGTLVVRARIEARLGRIGDALVHLFEAELHHPTPGYLAAFVLDATSDAALSSLDAARVGQAAIDVAIGSAEVEEPVRTATLDRAYATIEPLLSHHPRCEPLAFAASMLLRRLDRNQESIAVADAFLVHTPEAWRLWMALGNACTDEGDYARADQAYARAQELQPDNLAIRLDRADMQGSIGGFEQAIALYRSVLDHEPEHPWALPSWLYYRWLSLDDPADAQALAKLAASTDGARARELHAEVAVYDERLQVRPESLLKLVAMHPPDAHVRVGISSLEAPSAIRVAGHLVGSLTLEMGDAEGVDPRVPRRDVKTVLWRYRSAGIWPFRELTHDADALDDACSAEVSAAIHELARERYSAREWFRRAAEIAVRLGPASGAACAAAMVEFDLDAVPAELELADWTFRVQVAAAFVIAHLPDGEAMLWDIVYGPADWVSDAAITALAQIAIEEPSQRARIAAELHAQIDALHNPIGHMCLSMPAALNLLRIPGIAPELRETARQVRNAELSG